MSDRDAPPQYGIWDAQRAYDDDIERRRLAQPHSLPDDPRHLGWRILAVLGTGALLLGVCLLVMAFGTWLVDSSV